MSLAIIVKENDDGKFVVINTIKFEPIIPIKNLKPKTYWFIASKYYRSWLSYKRKKCKIQLYCDGTNREQISDGLNYTVLECDYNKVSKKGKKESIEVVIMNY